MAKTQFNYTGAIQTFTIPTGVTYLTMKVWGAGGGGQAATTANGAPGAGGYSFGGIYVTPGQVLSILVGQGGLYRNSTTSAFGGGGIGGAGSAAGSGGGGRSGVAFLSQSQFIIAGGGGGAGIGNVSANLYVGGNGGGNVGNNTVLTTLTPPSSLAPAGGTQSTGGTGGSYAGTVASSNGSAGTSLQGGNGGVEVTAGSGSGGGGGGGYFGGGGGAGSNETANTSQQEQPGAGGSGYVNTSILVNSFTVASIPNTIKTNAIPPNSGDSDYVTGIGVGFVSVALANGGNGLVVFNYTPQSLTKLVDKTTATIGDIINYTLVYTGDGNVYNNAFLLDTIPANTSFVTDSVFVNNAQQVGSNPNAPGVSLTTIGPSTTTVTFSVKVTSLPTPNTIPNSASIYATSVPSIFSNSVSTSIFSANLTSSKTVSKNYANIGDILTYTIPVTNTQNTTANNVLFIDTIPNGTSLVIGSFNQDGTAIATSPNPPGANLPNAIGGGKTSTITFKVKVDTIPNPNPISNTASLSYNFTVAGTTIVNSTNTNTVNTQINNASLGGIIKYVDKSFATCGDIITYTIIAPNSGNVTAQNVIVKDTIPNGTVLLPTTVYVNGVQQLGANLTAGITIPNIAPGTTATLNFSVQVLC